MNRFTGLNAKQDVVGIKIVALAVVAIVSGDDGKREVFRQFDEQWIDLFLLRQLVVLYLDVVALRENGSITHSCSFGLLYIARHKRLRHFALQTGAESNQAAVHFSEQFFIDTRLVVEAFHKTERDQLAEISIPLMIHRQKDEVVVVFFRSLVDALLLQAAS